MNKQIIPFKCISYFSLLCAVHLIGCVSSTSLIKINQLSLEMESTLKDFDRYLESYIGDGSAPLALLLDYDGTLAPIAPHPNLTQMAPDTNETLISLSKNPKIFTSVISGRGVDNVREKIGINGVIYAGNHGLEIVYPNGTRYNHQIPGAVSGNFTKLVAALEKEVARDGAWIENKGVSLTFHYRATPEEQHESIKTQATEIIKRFGYNDNQAHCAIEAKPPVQWNKGFAAEYILEHSFGTNWRNDVKIIFVGDDTTDEDIFGVVGSSGVTFRVTKDPNISTKATYKIPSTMSVTTLLKWIQLKYSN